MKPFAPIAGLVGTAGSLACTLTMAAALAGALGSGAAAGARATTTWGSMSGMESEVGGPVGVLIEYGPEILAVSVLLVTAAFARRRALTAVPAAAAGLLLLWGMYRQGNLTVMYLTIALSYTAWTASWWWTSPRRRPGSSREPVTR